MMHLSCLYTAEFADFERSQFRRQRIDIRNLSTKNNHHWGLITFLKQHYLLLVQLGVK